MVERDRCAAEGQRDHGGVPMGVPFLRRVLKAERADGPTPGVFPPAQGRRRRKEPEKDGERDAGRAKETGAARSSVSWWAGSSA
jgi:hypothetical protein